MAQRQVKGAFAHNFACTFEEARRRVRSWPFDTLIGAFCPTFRALSDAPISVANGRDLGPLRASQKVHTKNVHAAVLATIGEPPVHPRKALRAW